jgi:sec-independent protein translocase protein TatA
MGSFSPIHWLVVILILLLLFGAGRLSEIGKGLGEGIKNFKKGLQDDPKEDEKSIANKEPKQLSSKPDDPSGEKRA